jgi:hypothetical protein
MLVLNPRQIAPIRGDAPTGRDLAGRQAQQRRLHQRAEKRYAKRDSNTGDKDGHGRGLAHYESLADENVVALCDVNEARFPDALKRFPKAKTYVDWRKCLEQKDIDAVVCCTADHTHAFIANWALNRDLHVYMRKAAGHQRRGSPRRARELPEEERQAGHAGRHAAARGENFNRVRELIRDGAIGELTAAYAWGNRQIRRPATCPPRASRPRLPLRPLARPVAEHPYNPGYFSGGPGMNCLSVEHVLGLRRRPDRRHGQPHDGPGLERHRRRRCPPRPKPRAIPSIPTSRRSNCESHFEHPANDWRGPIASAGTRAAPCRVAETLSRSEQDRPRRDVQGLEGLRDVRLRFALLLPFGDNADLTYYKPRDKSKVLPPLGHFQKQWIDACKGPASRRPAISSTAAT